jgi:hypothetical protein
MWRRWSLALALSVLAHLGLVIAGLGLGARGRLGGPVDIEITGMRLDELKELPLGGPARGGAPKPPARRRARNHPAPPAASGTLVTHADDRARAGAASATDDDDSGPAPTSDLAAYGPPGSRLTVLLRLDRLRGTEYATAVDALLMRLPDRRDLLEGTGLDLFASFDALLIATPHPLDPSVTFLAVRHHVDDAALRAALVRGALATDRVLSWRKEDGRPVGERHARHGAAGSTPGARDERIIVLAAPGLVVVTPPAYRAMLLAPRPLPPAGPDAGSAAHADSPDADAPDADAVDASVVDAGARPVEALGWAQLLSRIGAEEGLMPPTGDLMVSAVDIFKTSGTPGEGPRVLHGLEIPPAVRGLAGIDDGPYVDVEGDFETEEPARHWESEWPAVLGALRTNPYLVLGGFSPLLSRATLTREGRVVHLHLAATHDETLRLLALALRLLGG